MYMFFALTDNNNSKEGGVRYVEPEQFNVAMLRAATNNFSEENKLGEGGFGEVFKVHFHLYVYTTRSCSVIGICGQCLFQLIDRKHDLRQDNNSIGNGSCVGLKRPFTYTSD